MEEYKNFHIIIDQVKAYITKISKSARQVILTALRRGSLKVVVMIFEIFRFWWFRTAIRP